MAFEPTDQEIERARRLLVRAYFGFGSRSLCQRSKRSAGKYRSSVDELHSRKQIIMTTIQLGKLNIPAREFAAQGNAILGIRESGKSYTATAIAEQLLEAGIPWVAFDPIGIWRNLKVPGPGPHGKGFQVVVAGEGGDLPLDPESASQVVGAAMAENIPLVIDLYSMELSKKDWRTIVETCVRKLLYENKRHGLRHIFIEEASEFAPQRVQPDQGRVYAEIEKLGRMGGNASLGFTLINQRGEEVNKAVLELCDLLILHRQKGRNSLVALEKWLSYSGGDAKDIARQIPMLAAGECFVWVGEESHPVRTQIQAKRSYHPDRRNPDISKEAKSAQVNVAEFVRKLSLQLEVKKIEVEQATVAILSDEQLITDLKRALTDAQNDREDAIRKLVNLQAQVKALADLNNVELLSFKIDGEEVLQEEQEFNPGPAAKPAFFSDNHRMGRCEREILKAAVQRHPKTSSLAQLAVLSAYSVRSSGFKNAISKLRVGGLIEGTGKEISPTDAGIKAVGPQPKAPKGRDLRSQWVGKVGKAAGAILEAACLNPRGMTKEEMSIQTGYSVLSSGFKNALSRLRVLELISPGPVIKPHPELL